MSILSQYFRSSVSFIRSLPIPQLIRCSNDQIAKASGSFSSSVVSTDQCFFIRQLYHKTPCSQSVIVAVGLLSIFADNGFQTCSRFHQSFPPLLVFRLLMVLTLLAPPVFQTLFLLSCHLILPPKEQVFHPQQPVCAPEH